MFGINGFGRSNNNYYKNVYEITPIPSKTIEKLKGTLENKLAKERKEQEEREEWLRSLNSLTDAFLLGMFQHTEEFEDGCNTTYLMGGHGMKILTTVVSHDPNIRVPNPKYEDIRREILRRGLEVHTDNKKKKREET